MNISSMKKSQPKKVKTKEFGVSTYQEIGYKLGVSSSAVRFRAKKLGSIDAAIDYYKHKEGAVKKYQLQGESLSLSEIAIKIGVSVTTIYKWLRDGLDLEVEIERLINERQNREPSAASVNASLRTNERKEKAADNDFGHCVSQYGSMK